jgi:hypothetical protein
LPHEDGVEQGRLAGLQGDDAAKDVKQVHEIAGVLVRPVLGLDVAERGRLAAVADDRAG